jgi:hypothetical protein
VVIDSKISICWYDIKSCLHCSAGANGSQQGQQPVSVWRHDTEYLDRKKPARAVDGLTDWNNLNYFFSFRRYFQLSVNQQ